VQTQIDAFGFVVLSFHVVPDGFGQFAVAVGRGNSRLRFLGEGHAGPATPTKDRGVVM
jgi:hypothetical protein